MSAELALALITLAALVLYALSGGADYGGGIWDLLATGPRAQRQRDVIEHAIAPIWEANHVWLVLVVVVLFTAFPVAFGAMMTALHVPITLVLLGVVFRGSAFAFRKYDPGSRKRWGRIFGMASFATPFFLGLTLGGLASGDIRVEDGRVTTGFFAGWTSPFALACGAYAQGLFAFLAAVYLTVDAWGDAEVQRDFRARAVVAGVALAPVAALVFALARDGAPHIFRGLTGSWAPLLLLATSICAVTALVALWLNRFRTARVAAAGQVTLILIGWALAQYPYLVVPDVTIVGAAAAPATLRILLWALILGAVVLLPSFAYLFYVFRGRSGARDRGG